MIGMKDNYFIAGNGFKSLKDPMYEELASLLESVKNSQIFMEKRTYNFDYGNYIADDFGYVFDDERRLCYSSSNEVYYNKRKGSLFIRIGGICNFALAESNGWEKSFLEKLARCASRIIIGLVSGDVNQVLVHNGIFYNHRYNKPDYPWKGKPVHDEITVTEFMQENNTFSIMGIYRIPNQHVKYESDGDGFILEDQVAADYWLASHNTIAASTTENEEKIHTYSTTGLYRPI